MSRDPETLRIGDVDFPRASLVPQATPLEPLERLCAAEDLNAIWMKRDDMTGLALGGNKARQLEFYFGEALRQGADTILITGAVQSNYVRMAAAGARRFGMHPILQLEERVAGMDQTYQESGNVLLDKILGAELHPFPVGEDESAADENLERLADQVRARGGKPYVIHLGMTYPPLGALGYVVGAWEMMDQVTDLGLKVKAVVLASGSGQTHAGTLIGLRLRGCEWPVIGGCVRRDQEAQVQRMSLVAGNLAKLVGQPDLFKPEDLIITDRFLGPGYGKNSDTTWEALKSMARLEGIILDPVYTSKSFATARAAATPGDPLSPQGEGVILYLHTGGQPALFGYATVISEALAKG